mgnify:CR=1 FL=1
MLFAVLQRTEKMGIKKPGVKAGSGCIYGA